MTPVYDSPFKITKTCHLHKNTHNRQHEKGRKSNRKRAIQTTSEGYYPILAMPAPSKYYQEAIPPRNALDKARSSTISRSQSRSRMFKKPQEQSVSKERTENSVSISLKASRKNPVKTSVSTSFFSVSKLRGILIGGSPTNNQQTTRQSVEETSSRHTTVSIQINRGKKKNSKKR